jgi:hypothetical protein
MGREDSRLAAHRLLKHKNLVFGIAKNNLILLEKK